MGTRPRFGRGVGRPPRAPGRPPRPFFCPPALLVRPVYGSADQHPPDYRNRAAVAPSLVGVVAEQVQDGLTGSGGSMGDKDGAMAVDTPAEDKKKGRDYSSLEQDVATFKELAKKVRRGGVLSGGRNGVASGSLSGFRPRSRGRSGDFTAFLASRSRPPRPAR